MSEPQEPDELNLSSDQSQTDPAKQNAFKEDGEDFYGAGFSLKPCLPCSKLTFFIKKMLNIFDYSLL